MTKEELKEYTETKREIKIIEEKIEYLESKKTSIKSQVITDMPRGEADPDRLGHLLVQIEELIDLYNEKHNKLWKQQLKIENVIDNLHDSIDRNIMRLKYIDGYTWERICVIIGYSWNGIHKKHRKILDKIR